LEGYRKCDNKILTDGALPAKTKILMALAVVASKQCEACTVSQMKSALKNGATKEEIMETMDVIFITSGAPAVAACRNALKLLK
jgi:AhpD family alkylhydroperoxidase